MADTGVDEDAGAGVDGGWPTEMMLGGARPAPMHVPAGYDGTPRPLLILLHGYGVDGQTQDAYFGLSALVDEKDYFLIVPDGTPEASAEMNRFWNATDACCDFYQSGVDDVAYLLGLIDEAKQRVEVDRVYVAGHSNGGFMSYRLACEASDVVRAVVSLAGSTFLDGADCGAVEPVSVLQIHGDQDGTVFFDGLMMGGLGYPGAEETVRRWAARAGCDDGALDQGTPFDLDTGLAGDETTVSTHRTGCAPGVEAELWRIQGGGHIPALAPDFGERIIDWVLSH